jgi:hypothetical protein
VARLTGAVRSARISEGQFLLGSLHAQGMTNAQIARRVQRDSSLLSQHQRGAKPPSESLLGALRDLVGGREPAPVERRAQRVRQGVERLPNNVQRLTVATQQSAEKQIRSAAASGRQVYITVQFKDGRTMELYKRGGYNAQELQRKLQTQSLQDFIEAERRRLYPRPSDDEEEEEDREGDEIEEITIQTAPRRAA